MRGVSIHFEKYDTAPSIHIDGRSFIVTREAIRTGRIGIMARLHALRSRNTIALDITDEELQEGTRLLLENKAVQVWAEEQGDT